LLVEAPAEDEAFDVAAALSVASPVEAGVSDVTGAVVPALAEAAAFEDVVEDPLPAAVCEPVDEAEGDVVVWPDEVCEDAAGVDASSPD
jgi:hypothetical protein